MLTTMFVVSVTVIVFQVVGKRVRARRFERVVREARDAMAGEIEYRVPTAADAELVRLLTFADSDRVRLERCNFTYLGDLVMQPVGRPPYVVMRVLVDSATTTCAYLMVSPKQRKHPILVFESYTEGDEYLTQRRQPSLAQPPTAHVQMIDEDLTHGETLDRHRVFAGVEDPDKGHVSIESLDDAKRELEKCHARMIAWRASIAPDVLLDADLQWLLGAYYEHWGRGWAYRLAGRLPSARVYQRSRASHGGTKASQSAGERKLPSG